MIYDNLPTTQAYAAFKEGKPLTELSDEELTEVSNTLHKRLIKDSELSAFRDVCKKEVSRRVALNKKHQRIKDELVPQLYSKMECAYDITNFLQLKILAKIKAKQDSKTIEEYVRDAGRTVGSKLYDLPSIQTGMYSVDALSNIKANENSLDKVSKNTNEHFFSLYANAGPFILRKAMFKTIQTPRFDPDPYNGFTIRLMIRMVSRLNQTIKTTKDENNRLQKYHSFNSMIGVQHSYEQAEVSPLVDCGLDDSTEIYLKWHYLCESVGIPLKMDAGKHFDEVLTMDEAFEKHPEVAGVERYLTTK